MNILRKILVKFGLSGKCPYCGARLVNEGYPDMIWQRIRCDECGWGKE